MADPSSRFGPAINGIFKYSHAGNFRINTLTRLCGRPTSHRRLASTTLGWLCDYPIRKQDHPLHSCSRAIEHSVKRRMPENQVDCA
ncbi:hypothetical protein Agabi119p4_2723 [Agaricus bisporus var. burnettii]|uniref:Uncharacterized protein n=1 Tax=Agaricus bisporus var. burnettii TaxID=192524 RepID=A0A8H7KKG0_AGABI|nr:hypothetical protein Agabi119p4_2723 [Agaricus bisporus var. burnettii]